MCCTRLAENAGRKNRKKFAIWAPSYKFARLYLRNQGMYRQSGKSLLNSNISFTRAHNMANFGPLAAKISLGNPSKFQRVWRVGFVNAPTSLNGRQPTFARRLAVSRAGTLYTHFRELLPP